MTTTMTMTNAGASPELHSPRLLLRAPSPALCEAVRDFQLRNREHLAPWDPPQPPDFLTPEVVLARLQQGADEFAAGAALRYWFARRVAPAVLIGQIGISQLSRGPFQNASLGYSLDAHAQGQGLMHEALQAVIAELFGPRVRLHRLQAAVRPENRRSRAVLQRLGFSPIGLSRRYLFIAGAWRDHELFDLVNPAWPDDQAP
ncbi:alanine acetyltransferase [Paucibacter aquatile]|uniref:Alanine acetyltransferase n=2 Tax=Kinneretia aquatilis TaxID=2070761 RepID=A0A2N8KVD4_9BURK|nr:alanine acetyltransferase [Paucibacter aquatile]